MNAPDKHLADQFGEMLTTAWPMPKPAVTQSEIACEMAEAECLADPEKYGSWLQSVNSDRHMALWFMAPMSAGELMAVQMGDKADDYQRTAATFELRRRYLKDQCADIAARSLELQEPGTGYNGIVRHAAERIAR